MSTPPASGSPYASAPQTPPGPYTTSAPAYAAAPPAAVPGIKGKTGPLALIIVGLVLLVVAAAVLIGSVVSVARVSSPLSQVPSSSAVAAELRTGNVYGIYSDGLSATACAVTAPDGAEVPLIEVHSSIEVNDHALVATFIPTVSGSYTVTCTTSGNEPIFLGEATNAKEIGWMAVGAIGSVLGGLLGASLLVGGLAWLLVRRSRNRRILQAQAMGPAYSQPGCPQSVPQPGAAPDQNGQWFRP
ncbi:hypothetical protein [Actinomyces faecalis]|uniref:hypothetical protein n=1 Tax=Actinomyces faecalis TaxID=2722820 RepID=UPI001553AB8C|nr:hypothetical protein [Actinomyces faecalis]